MKAKEKQVITALSAAIVVVAAALIFCLAAENRSTSGEQQSAALEDQDESDSGSGTTEAKDSGTTEKASTETSTEDDSDGRTAAEIMDADDGYVFPDSNTSYLTESEVEKLSTEEIQYAINEVYARHGLKFTKKTNQERFEKKKWYTGTVDDQNDISLNKYEKKNVSLMADILEQRGAR